MTIGNNKSVKVLAVFILKTLKFPKMNKLRYEIIDKSLICV